MKEGSGERQLLVTHRHNSPAQGRMYYAVARGVRLQNEQRRVSKFETADYWRRIHPSIHSPICVITKAFFVTFCLVIPASRRIRREEGTFFPFSIYRCILCAPKIEVWKAFVRCTLMLYMSRCSQMFVQYCSDITWIFASSIWNIPSLSVSISLLRAQDEDGQSIWR